MSDSSSIQVPAAEGCAFCDYLGGRRPYTIAWRSKITAILVTREQRGSSHVLVVPVAHRETILDLREPELSELMRTIVMAARAIDAAEGRPGIAVWQNNGVTVDQTIPHVHFHVAGSLPGSGGTERGAVDELGLDVTEEIARRLRLHLSQAATVDTD